LGEVQDTGPGIAPEVREKTFQSFLTTRASGRGTGLGLSIAHKIIEEHDGRIEVDSVLGEGSTFRVLLPACEPAAGSDPQPES
jgi:signal transduction histidine kinase